MRCLRALDSDLLDEQLTSNKDIRKLHTNTVKRQAELGQETRAGFFGVTLTKSTLPTTHRQADHHRD